MLASKHAQKPLDSFTVEVARVTSGAHSGAADSPTELSRLFERFTESSRKLEDKYASLTTEVEELKAQLRRKEEEIKRSERLAMLGETAAALAHEVRNPLGAITLFLSMLRGDISDRPQAVGLVDEIDKSVTSLNNVVSNVLHFAKSNRVTCAPLNVHAIILELAQHFSSLYGPACTITTELNANPFIVGDEQALRQCFYNLIMNSLQAMSFAGALTVISADRVADESLMIVVHDNGPGIPATILGRLFEPFVSGRECGTGLGLSIVKRIVHAHGGTISAENEKGAKFVLNVPRRSSDSSKRSQDGIE